MEKQLQTIDQLINSLNNISDQSDKIIQAIDAKK